MGALWVGGTLLVDPTTAEEREADGSVMLAHMASLGEVSQVVVTGQWEGDALDNAIQLAASGCANADQVIRDTLRGAAA